MITLLVWNAAIDTILNDALFYLGTKSQSVIFCHFKLPELFKLPFECKRSTINCFPGTTSF